MVVDKPLPFLPIVLEEHLVLVDLLSVPVQGSHQVEHATFDAVLRAHLGDDLIARNLSSGLVARDVVQDRDASLRENIFDKLREILFRVASVGANGHHDIVGLDVRKLVLDVVQDMDNGAAAAPAGHRVASKVADDALGPGKPELVCREISLRLGDGISVDKHPHLLLERGNGDPGNKGGSSAPQSEAIVVPLHSDIESRLENSGSVTSRTIIHCLDGDRSAALDGRNPHDSLVIDVIHLDIKGLASFKEGDICLCRRGCQNPDLAGWDIKFCSEISLAAAEPEHGILGRSDPVASLPLCKGVELVDLDKRLPRDEGKAAFGISRSAVEFYKFRLFAFVEPKVEKDCRLGASLGRKDSRH